MAIDIREVTDGDSWNELLAQSADATPFHRSEFLDVCAEYANATLYPYVGYKGEEPVGLFPIFEAKKGPYTMAFSPPGNLKIVYLGPALLNAGRLKVRKHEQRNRRFIEGVLERIDREVNPRYVKVHTTPTYADERPFQWADFDATPRYTYVLDLTPDTEELVAAFSSDARRAVRSEVDGFEITAADADEVRELMERVAARHREKDVAFTVPPSFITDLYHGLPDEMVHAYVARLNGEFCAGQFALEYGDTIYAWHAVADRSHSVPSLVLIDWHIIQIGKERGCNAYDLVGADVPEISKAKAKLAPDLRTYYTLIRGTWDTRTAGELYKRLRR